MCLHVCAHTLGSRTHARAVGLGIVGELLLSWQGWVLIGTPSVWYECWCHGENSSDRPTLIHSYGGLLSPEGLQIIKAFTTLNTHAPHPLTARVCVSHMSVLATHVQSLRPTDLSALIAVY